MKDRIRAFVREAAARAVDKGLFLDIPDAESLEIEVTRAKDERFGDYATNAAMVLAGRLKTRPRDLAQVLLDQLPEEFFVFASAEIAGPGFINFSIHESEWHRVLETIHHEKGRYGTAPQESGARVLLEFVSANPTGPLHVGHGRGAAVGDTLARLLKAVGYRVETEYYVNDAGNQMKILGRSVLYRYLELRGKSLEFPENHYRGDYIWELARELMDTELGRELEDLPEEQAVLKASTFACERILEGIQEDLALFGVRYDSYYSEKSLHEKAAIAETIKTLETKGKVEHRDGAVWFTMEGEQDEKDRVLVRATGEPTYFAADAAYHEDKIKRGFERLIDIWGSDHHGYVPRVKAALQALGHSADLLDVLLVQFVTLVREGQKVSMSTRSGEFVTLREVIEEVGSDAARFFFLTKRADSHLDFDLDLAKKQTKDNPVFYVQYAHARVRSIFRIAEERSIDTDMTDPELSMLTLPEEQKLMKRLADYPDMIMESARALEPHRVTFYLVELAELFHAYYHDNRILVEDERIKKARLYLVEALRQVIANGLGILGVSAPDRM